MSSDNNGERNFDVLIRVWDPICGMFGGAETLVNHEPLTEAEADEMMAELLPCVDNDYRGQGQTLHSVRKARKRDSG